jgi:predicted MFS family arabinose efflux permease
MTHPDPIETIPDARVEGAPTAVQIKQALGSTRIQFALLGVLSGAWGVHIPSVKLQYDLGEMALSGLLLAAAFGAVSSLFFAGRVIGRIGPRGATALAAGVMGVLLALVLHWPSVWMLALSMWWFGTAMSLYDVAINTEGSALEALGGRAVMGNLHGMFSVGGMTGAALTGALLRAEVPAATQLLGVGLGMALCVWAASRTMLRTHPQDESQEPKAQFAWPRGTLLLIGLLIFAGMSAEGVMYDWCVLYLKQEVGMTQDMAAWGYAAFSGAMAVARFTGDSLRERFSEGSILKAGGLTAAAAMATVLVSGDPWVSVLGYALVGAGLAPVVPILFNAATRVPGTTRAAAIASVSSIGYAGFMVGPPLIGTIAQSASLTWAMGVVVVTAAALAWGARHVPLKAPAAQASRG